MNCGGYMEEGGDYNSPTNYGSFNVPMAYGGGLPKAQKGNNPNYKYTPLSKKDSTNVMRQLEKPEFQPGYSYRVSKNRNNVYQTSPSGQENEYNGWQSNTAKHAALQEFIARQDLAAGKVPSQPPVFADTYNQYRGIVKEDGGILDASNNMSYPTFEDGGKYNLLNLIKAASKKMKKAYGGDTVTQGGNSDNYPQGITDAFKRGIQANTMNALMNEEQDVVSDVIKQMGGYAGGYNSGNMYNNYNQQPQFDRKNQSMQNMYQQRIDDTQANLKNDSKYFGQSMNYLGATANPYTKNTIKAADGVQVLLNKQTGKPFTAEEYADYQKYFGKNASQEPATSTEEPRGNIYNYGPGQGTNYFPMNYRPYSKISRADDAMLRQLAANPSTNLKEYKNWNAPLGFGRTKMTFGYKDVNKEFTPTGNKEFNASVPQFGPGSIDTGRTVPAASIYPAGQNLLDMIPNAANFDKAASGLPQPMNQEVPPNLSGDWNSMLNQQALPPNVKSKAYGGVAKYQTAGQTPISFPSWGSPIGGNTQTPTPQSAGFGQKPTMMNGVTDQAAPITAGKTTGFEGTTGPEKTATVTQKRRPGFNGEAMANALIAGTNMASSFLESGQNAKNKKKLSELQLADNAFVSTPGNAQSRGDYDPNSGMFRPDDMVPVQFAGYGAYGGSFQDGGMQQQQQQQPDPQQVMQGVATMLQQGAKPEQVAKQLVEMGIPQEQVVQIIQTVMQQLQGGQEGQEEPQQQPMRYGGFATGGAAEEESYEEDLNEDEIAELRAQGYDVEYI
jgi:hypothetical protein